MCNVTVTTGGLHVWYRCSDCEVTLQNPVPYSVGVEFMTEHSFPKGLPLPENVIRYVEPVAEARRVKRHYAEAK